MGVPVDATQARVAARALTKSQSQNLREMMRESLDDVHCRSPWSWFRRATKKIYQTYEREGRGVLWMHQETTALGKRSASAALGRIEGHGGQLHAYLELMRKTRSRGVSSTAGTRVVVTRHAIEAMFHKVGRLDRDDVQIDILQAVTSLFLMSVVDESYWDGGYRELEVRTQNGVALVSRDAEEPVYTIATWVPEAQLRPEQRIGWNTNVSPNARSYLLAAGARPLPRISTCVHRRALSEGRFTKASQNS